MSITLLFGISHKQLKFTGNYCCIDCYLKYRQDQLTIVKQAFPKNQASQREAGILLPAFRDGLSLVWLLHPF